MAAKIYTCALEKGQLSPTFPNFPQSLEIQRLEPRVCFSAEAKESYYLD
jgi:hypothetical protein